LTISSDWLPITPFFSGEATGSVTQHAKLYDVLFSDYALDIPMYLRELPPHLGVLECGMGTGRITMPLAQSGRPVVGVDNSDAMLEELKSKLGDDPSVRTKIKIVKADLRSFNLNECFKSVICPFMTFNYFLTLQDRVSFLNCASRSMAPDGVLWLELMTMSTLPEMNANDRSLRKVRMCPSPDLQVTYAVYRTVSFDSASQIVEQDRHYIAYDMEGRCKGTTLVTWRNRYVSLGELEATLSLCGLKIDAVYGDHNMGPYLSSSQFLIAKVRHK
jgi:ubiquinone/menaquinone biosynthesis C-methylase UbiE